MGFTNLGSSYGDSTSGTNRLFVVTELLAQQGLMTGQRASLEWKAVIEGFLHVRNRDGNPPGRMSSRNTVQRPSIVSSSVRLNWLTLIVRN